MSTIEEQMKKRMEDLYINSKGEASKPDVPKPKLEDMFKVRKPKGDLVEFEEVVGEPHEDGEKHYWPKSIVHSATDWPDVLQKRIPSDFFFVPDHEYACHILDMLAYDKVLQATGDPGSGKDSQLKWICAKLQIPYVREDGAEGKEISDLLGYCVPSGVPGEFIESEGLLTLMAKYGGLYVASEPFVNPPAVNMVFQSLLESDRIFKFIGHPDAEKAQFRAHEWFRIAFTTNSRGTADDLANYAAVVGQDQSTLNRVDIHCHKTYLKSAQEEQMLAGMFPEINSEGAKKMVQMANMIRASWKDGGVSLPFSPRQLITWAEAIVRTGNPVYGFKQCYFNACNETEQGTISRFWKDIDFRVPLN